MFNSVSLFTYIIFFHTCLIQKIVDFCEFKKMRRSREALQRKYVFGGYVLGTSLPGHKSSGPFRQNLYPRVGSTNQVIICMRADAFGQPSLCPDGRPGQKSSLGLPKHHTFFLYFTLTLYTI